VQMVSPANNSGGIFKEKMKNFKQLLIWQKGFEIAVQSFKLIETFPKEERFSLSNQITRAAVSISLNIAEGSSRTSEKDYKRFLELSLGSSFELETQLLIAEAIKFGDPVARAKIMQDVIEETENTGFIYEQTIKITKLGA
jgi:four helix bundle protein